MLKGLGLWSLSIRIIWNPTQWVDGRCQCTTKMRGCGVFHHRRYVYLLPVFPARSMRWLYQLWGLDVCTEFVKALDIHWTIRGALQISLSLSEFAHTEGARSGPLDLMLFSTLACELVSSGGNEGRLVRWRSGSTDTACSSRCFFVRCLRKIITSSVTVRSPGSRRWRVTVL